ncbi:hypothetical protein PVK06_048719 [Gossypium arboreum]|uniref:Uncharacterized protein n=1 Tax=Gossypium arboreum TaxID=29729 RepID=A0ABR0MIP9_GOSAR|nr:hypothetical protein PVK06_048719 [Gossypium arboreum]
MGSSSTPTQHAPPMSTLIPYHFTPLIPIHFTKPMLFFTSTTLCTTAATYLYPSRRYIFQGTSIPSILRFYADVDADINADVNANTNVNPNINISIAIYDDTDAIVSLFYRGGSSVQSPSRGVVDTRWEVRMALHSSTDEGNGDEDEAKGGDDAFKDIHKSGDEDEEHEDVGHDPIEELTPLVMHRNPTYNHQPSLYGTHSARRR